VTHGNRTSSFVGRSLRLPLWPDQCFVSRFVELEEWQAQGIEDALGQAEDGKGIGSERVDPWLATWGSDSESEPPRCGCGGWRRS